jgi:hypothetical protein
LKKAGNKFERIKCEEMIEELRIQNILPAFPVRRVLRV